jgi:hypothetical protein
MDRNIFRRCLIHPAEHQKEIPEIDPDLNAVGVVLTIFGRVDELDLGRSGLGHSLQRNTWVEAGCIRATVNEPFISARSNLQIFTILEQPVLLFPRRME